MWRGRSNMSSTSGSGSKQASWWLPVSVACNGWCRAVFSCKICLIHLFLIYLIHFDVYMYTQIYTHIFSLYVHTSDTCLYCQRWLNKKNIHRKSSTTTSIGVKRKSGHGYPCCVSTYDSPPHHITFIELHTAKHRFFAPQLRNYRLQISKTRQAMKLGPAAVNVFKKTSNKHSPLPTLLGVSVLVG